MAKPKNDLPRPRPWPTLGKSVRCTVIGSGWRCELEILVNEKTRKAQSGIFTLDTINGATIRGGSYEN